nr:HAMP domain-containing protein [Rhodoferax sp.]
MTWSRRFQQFGLSSRIAALSLGLLLLVQAAVFSVVQLSIDRNARRQIAQELIVGERVWRRLLDQNAQKLGQGASLLAADYGFRSSVSTGDIDTIRSALENHGARIGATFTALLDTRFALQAVGEGQDSAALEPVLKQMAGSMSRSAQSGQIALVGHVPYQFVMVPMKAPLVIGWVLMGFPVNQTLLEEMHGLSDVHVAIVSRTANEPDRVVVSTLPPDALQALQLDDAEFRELVVAGDLLMARSVRLAAGAGDVRALLLRSVDQVVAPFRQGQVALAWVTAMGVILFGIGSVIAARRVTTPLRSLVSATERLGRGDYDTPMKYMKRHDEIGG